MIKILNSVSTFIFWFGFGSRYPKPLDICPGAHQDNEFLDSISECVLGKISAQIKASKYFAVELDCTPDISKQEQASVIIRYDHTDEKKKVYITESFLGFTAVKDTTGNGLTDTLTGVLDSLGLELTNCRGQSYDNGANEGHTQGCPSFNTTEMSRGSVHPLL